jgi:hypothetical protein
MKNFTYKALAVATAAVCGAGAQAGTVSSTTAKYAVEAITSTSVITLAPVIYTMGVARVVSQPFTIIVREPAGATTTLSCGAVPTVSGGGAASITVKRTSASECVWDVNVTTDFVVGTNITFPNLAINSHSLATVGATEKLNVALYDTGETARVDNSNDITATVATSGRAVSLTATTDNGTKADVNFNNGANPLFGFVVQNDDTATNASANFSIGVDGNFLNASGTAVTANSILTNVVVTIAGDFSGLKTTFTGAGNSSVNVTTAAPLSTAPGVTYSNTAGTAVFTINAGNLTQNGTTNVKVSLETAQTQSLGTARTFGVSAVANPTLAGVGAQALAGNASWWVWGANGIELRSAFFNNDTSNGNLTRFFFQNTGAQAADYSATCQVEAGQTVTYGASKSGKLTANGTTALNASDVCTFSGGKRGSITFTINANVGAVKGVYQQAINGAAAAYIPLERTYGNNNSSNGSNY